MKISDHRKMAEKLQAKSLSAIDKLRHFSLKISFFVWMMGSHNWIGKEPLSKPVMIQFNDTYMVLLPDT